MESPCSALTTQTTFDRSGRIEIHLKFTSQTTLSDDERAYELAADVLANVILASESAQLVLPVDNIGIEIGYQNHVCRASSVRIIKI